MKKFEYRFKRYNALLISERSKTTTSVSLPLEKNSKGLIAINDNKFLGIKKGENFNRLEVDERLMALSYNNLFESIIIDEGTDDLFELMQEALIERIEEQTQTLKTIRKRIDS